jgi:hypothetical protein
MTPDIVSYRKEKYASLLNLIIKNYMRTFLFVDIFSAYLFKTLIHSR